MELSVTGVVTIVVQIYFKLTVIQFVAYVIFQILEFCPHPMIIRRSFGLLNIDLSALFLAIHLLYIPFISFITVKEIVLLLHQARTEVAKFGTYMENVYRPLYIQDVFGQS